MSAAPWVQLRAGIGRRIFVKGGGLPNIMPVFSFLWRLGVSL